MRSSALEASLVALGQALDRLEIAAQRKLDLERRRGDLETELAIMQDDRARLATDLDSALTRVRDVEGAAEDAVERLDRAMRSIHAAMGAGDAAEPPMAER